MFSIYSAQLGRNGATAVTRYCGIAQLACFLYVWAATFAKLEGVR